MGLETVDYPFYGALCQGKRGDSVLVSWGMSDSPVGRSILAGQVGLLCYCEVRLGHEAKKFLAVLCLLGGIAKE